MFTYFHNVLMPDFTQQVLYFLQVLRSDIEKKKKIVIFFQKKLFPGAVAYSKP